jgi:hypothetical protein
MRPGRLQWVIAASVALSFACGARPGAHQRAQIIPIPATPESKTMLGVSHWHVTMNRGAQTLIVDAADAHGQVSFAGTLRVLDAQSHTVQLESHVQPGTLTFSEDGVIENSFPKEALTYALRFVVDFGKFRRAAPYDSWWGPVLGAVGAVVLGAAAVAALPAEAGIGIVAAIAVGTALVVTASLAPIIESPEFGQAIQSVVDAASSVVQTVTDALTPADPNMPADPNANPSDPNSPTPQEVINMEFDAAGVPSGEAVQGANDGLNTDANGNPQNADPNAPSDPSANPADPSASGGGVDPSAGGGGVDPSAGGGGVDPSAGGGVDPSAGGGGVDPSAGGGGVNPSAGGGVDPSAGGGVDDSGGGADFAGTVCHRTVCASSSDCYCSHY